MADEHVEGREVLSLNDLADLPVADRAQAALVLISDPEVLEYLLDAARSAKSRRTRTLAARILVLWTDRHGEQISDRMIDEAMRRVADPLLEKIPLGFFRRMIRMRVKKGLDDVLPEAGVEVVLRAMLTDFPDEVDIWRALRP